MINKLTVVSLGPVKLSFKLSEFGFKRRFASTCCWWRSASSPTDSIILTMRSFMRDKEQVAYSGVWHSSTARKVTAVSVFEHRYGREKEMQHAAQNDAHGCGSQKRAGFSGDRRGRACSRLWNWWIHSSLPEEDESDSQVYMFGWCDTCALHHYSLFVL